MKSKEVKKNDLKLNRNQKNKKNLHCLIHLFAILSLTAAVLLSYSNSLDGIWALDDVVINQPIGFEKVIDNFGARKISYLSFIINQKIDPNDPVNFRLFNIFIHIFNSILLYILIFVSFKSLNVPERDYNLEFSVAFVSSIIFALHPLNINAVSYIIQRMASLATFFVLISLLMYAFAIRSERLFKKILLYFFAFLFLIVGSLSKENAIVAIPLIILYDYFFISHNNKKAFHVRVASVLISGAIALLIISYYMPIYKLAVDILESFLAGSKPLSFKVWMARDVHWSAIEHLLTEFRVICHYLFLYVLPLPQFLVFDWWGYPISKGLLEPFTTILAIFFICSLLVFSILMRRKYLFLSFGVLWYLIAISLESFIAIGSDLYFEHRNYLPLTGLSFGLVGQAFFTFRERIFANKYNVWVIITVLTILLGFLTFQRNFVWDDPVTFWRDNVKKTPDNIRANLALANSYLIASDFQNARNYYLASVKISLTKKLPLFSEDSLYRLCFMHLMLQQLDEARKVMDTMEKLIPASYRLRILKGYFSFLNNEPEIAIKAYRDVLKDYKTIDRTDKATLHTLLADAYRVTNQNEKALNNYNKALSLNHSFSAAYHGMAKLYLSKGNLGAAEEYLFKVIKIDPNNFHALSDIAHLILIKGGSISISKALPYAEKSVSLKPPFYNPYLILGVILIALDREHEAEGLFNKASEYKAPEYQILFNKAWAYSLKGDKEKQKMFLQDLIKLKNVPQHTIDSAKKILSVLI